MDVKEKAHKSVILRSARVLIVAAPSNAAPDKRASYGRPMQRRGPEGPNSSLMLWRRSEVRNLDNRCEFGLEDLQRDLSLVLEVVRQIDGGHAALVPSAPHPLAPSVHPAPPPLSHPDRLATLPSAPRPCSEKPQKEEVVRV